MAASPPHAEPLPQVWRRVPAARAALAMCVAQWPAQAARADRLRASELELA